MPNRQWLLQRRPEGPVSPDCFRYHEQESAAGQDAAKFKVRYELLLCAPTIRNWISGARNSLHNVVEVGQPVLAPAVGRIVESQRTDWPAGARVFGLGSWQDEQWIDPSEGKFKLLRPGISSVQALGIAGPNSLTAYFGLLKVGRPESGECLVVSGGAGSVGSTAAQIGKLNGCKVIAICGGEEKRSWLTHSCGIENTIDYKSEGVAARLDDLAPNGIDIYFDNVGGELLRVCVDRMRRWGRIVMCGQIADYDDGSQDRPTRLNMMRLIYGHVRLEGFLARDYESQFDQAIDDLLGWSRLGALVQREDIRPGFDALPATFAALFRGDNRGTLIAKIADEEGRPV
jgi:NADPH-dependent curcumin reductase CurA